MTLQFDSDNDWLVNFKILPINLIYQNQNRRNPKEPQIFARVETMRINTGTRSINIQSDYSPALANSLSIMEMLFAGVRE